ncbi:MAG TPA: hypothetical protein VH853_00360 [Polyangia bacterium]|jgi:hypothetical protein|nr:hypothetical protein [Polyangia bacterium]
MTDEIKLAMAAVLLGVIGCGGGVYSAARDAGLHLAGRDGAQGDTSDGKSDSRGTESADAACSIGGWDAGPAAVASRDQATVTVAQSGQFEGFDNYIYGAFNASFLRAGTLVDSPPGEDDWDVAADGTGSNGAAVCNLRTFGPCVVTTTDCAIPPQPCARPQAGKLTLEFADRSSLVLSPNPDGTYTQTNLFDTGATLFAPGDLLTVTAAGSGDVPPFSLAVHAPGCLALSQPTLAPPPDGSAFGLPGTYTISRSQDLSLVWTGGETDATVGVDLISYSKYGDVVDLSCSFPATDGRGTIPQQALSSLEAGQMGGNLTIYQQSSASAQVGTFGVEFAVRNLGDDDALGDAGTCPSNNALVTYQ